MPSSCKAPFAMRPVSSTSAQARSNMRYGSLAVVLIGVAILGGCTEGVLDPKGPIAAADRQILLNSLGIMLAIVIPVILATLGVAFFFVRRMSVRTIGQISRNPAVLNCSSGRSLP